MAGALDGPTTQNTLARWRAIEAMSPVEAYEAGQRDANSWPPFLMGVWTGLGLAAFVAILTYRLTQG